MRVVTVNLQVQQQKTLETEGALAAEVATLWNRAAELDQKG
jgi:hypothetical protein